MSGTAKDWNTTEIKNFKESFRKFYNPVGFKEKATASFSNVSQELLAEAVAMLRKRKAVAEASFRAVVDARIATSPQQTQELMGALVDLQQRSDAWLTNSRKPANSVEVKAKTEQARDMAAEWISLEAKFLAANDQMDQGGDDAGVIDKLVTQTGNLYALLEVELKLAVNPLPPAPGGINLAALSGRIDTLVRMGTAIPDISAFTKEVYDIAGQLRSVVGALSQAPNAPGDLYQHVLKYVHGLDIQVAPDTPHTAIPYKAIADAFAKVPPQHGLNGALNLIELKKFDDPDLAGDYSSSQKRIRISVDVQLDAEWSYVDPETQQPVKVNGFAVTTLHEIGHSVDHAYNVMTAHGTDAGCGGWQRVDPAAYVAAEWTSFGTKWAGSADPDCPVQATLAAPAIKPAFVSYAVGATTGIAFAAVMEEFWIKTIVDAAQQGNDAVVAAKAGLDASITTFYATKRGAEPIAARVQALMTHVGTALPAAAAAVPSADFEAVATTSLGKGPDAAKLPASPDKLLAEVARLFALNLPHGDKVKLWAADAESSLPPGVDLSAHLAKAKPWQHAEVNATPILGLDGGHQAYDGEALWWHYNPSSRNAQSVTSYQWRAPGEWFAELYAITWLKQVEPPAAVAMAARQYMFGGHAA